jgi:hypothetical protein
MLNGTHPETFNQLFYLVDGIFPWLSQFLSTISVTITIINSTFSKWQESKWKDIERAFGMLKLKFLVLHPMLMHTKMTYSSILHNPALQFII